MKYTALVLAALATVVSGAQYPLCDQDLIKKINDAPNRVACAKKVSNLSSTSSLRRLQTGPERPTDAQLDVLCLYQPCQDFIQELRKGFPQDCIQASVDGQDRLLYRDVIDFLTNLCTSTGRTVAPMTPKPTTPAPTTPAPTTPKPTTPAPTTPAATTPSPTKPDPTKPDPTTPAPTTTPPPKPAC